MPKKLYMEKIAIHKVKPTTSIDNISKSIHYVSQQNIPKESYNSKS
jgi:hypothetical protein